MAHISLVTLGAHDLERATRFYEALGWRRSTASVAGTVAFLRGGAVALALQPRYGLAKDARVDAGRPDGRVDVALAMNVDSPEAVDATMATAVDAGGRVSRPAESTEWGGYSGYFLDPEGHLWEVAHNPGFGLLPDGRVILPDED